MEKEWRVTMTNPKTGKREAYVTTGTRAQVERAVSNVFALAGYTDIVIKEKVEG